MKSPLVRLMLFALLVSTGVFHTACSGNRNNSVTYEFTNVRRSTLERRVSSSGTINPVSTVNVLPRMSGKVEKVHVDYNDPVRVGAILAELNTDMLRLTREQRFAAVSKARTNYELQLITYQNQEILAARNLISEFELRSGKATLDNLASDLAVAEANLRVIETEINQYAYITSPINGIVLDRRINIGDTVVDSSSNNSSAIFVLAENLREMQIEAMVGELDVSSIYRGQSVRFSLESLPGRNFTGLVENIRMVPVVVNNVVNYTVIINVENQDGSLLPGMTCAVDFIVERSENALAVPNAALRYQPTTLDADKIAEMIFYASLANMDNEQRQTAIAAREQSAQSTQRPSSNPGIVSLLTGGNQTNRQPSRPSPGQGRRAEVVMRNLWYINENGAIQVMQVQTGISNGSLTEIFTTEDLEGKQIILRERI